MKVSFWYVAMASVFVTCLITANIIAVKLISPFGFLVPAAIIVFPLSYLFGDTLSYTDNTEELWDIKPRVFHSFREAAEEAAISRLYGGIHYRDGVTSGQVQGKAIGEYMVSRFKGAGIKPLR